AAGATAISDTPATQDAQRPTNRLVTRLTFMSTSMDSRDASCRLNSAPTTQREAQAVRGSSLVGRYRWNEWPGATGRPNESQFPRSQRRRGSSRREKRGHNGSEQRLSGGLVRGVLCDLLGIEVPVIQAGMSIFTSPSLAAAVSNAGALGSLGAWNRPPDQL